MNLKPYSLRLQGVLFLLAFLSILKVSAEDLKFYSQFGQDRYLYETFFKNKSSGMFVDVGAHDGISLSNTYFFEKHLGWTGICIEPIPEVFENLKRNRGCTCIQGCIFNQSEEVCFLKVSGYAEMLSGIIENYHPSHKDRIEKEVGSYGGSVETITVKCYDLTKLLLDRNITYVDYLSIDTEGGELDILKSINFCSIEIDVIEVENNYGDDFETFMNSSGYDRIIKLGPDEIYRKKKKNHPA